MERFRKRILAIIVMLLILVLFGVFIPSIREGVFGFLCFLGRLFKEFFLSEFIGKICILLVIAIIGSAFCITKRDERKLWGIFTGILTLIMGLLMFVVI